MRSDYLAPVQILHATEVIDVQAIFNDYWSSTKHEITASSQLCSSTSLLVFDGKAQRTLLSLESTTGIVGV